MNHDQRLMLIRGWINGIKPIPHGEHVRLKPLFYIFEIISRTDASNDRYLDPRRFAAENYFKSQTSEDESSHFRLRRMVWAVLIDGAYEDRGRSAVVVHFAIWSSTKGDRTLHREEWCGPSRSIVVKEVGLDQWPSCTHVR